MTSYADDLSQHYRATWDVEPVTKKWFPGPMNDIVPEFQVFEFDCSPKKELIAYATCGMSALDEEAPLEVFLLSRVANDSLIELLTVVSFYHRTSARLGLGHTVNFGRPWLRNSSCTFGLLSLPYLYGPALEWFGRESSRTRILWLIPISKAERDFKQKSGLEALESKFEESSLKYLDWNRRSAV